MTLNFYDIILAPFAWLLRNLYFVFDNYGVAVILFCFVTKLILFPLSMKAKKSMVRMNAVSARQQQLKKQFANDKAKLNYEVQKLYEEEKINPMGGCLWSLIPLPILIGLYSVLREPLKHLMSLTTDQINEVANFLGMTMDSANAQIDLAKVMGDRFAEVSSALNLGDKIFALDYTFLGIDLAATPELLFFLKDGNTNWNTLGLFFIPFLSAILSYVSMSYSMNGKKNMASAGTNGSMLITMPLISLWIGFTMPAALGVYWIANSVLMMAQDMLANVLLKGEYEAVEAAGIAREARRREEEKERRRQEAEHKAKLQEEQKRRQAERKQLGNVQIASRVGMRPYARGRNYDPNRFGGVTPYRDPSRTSSEIDEDALEFALDEKIVETGVAAPAVELEPDHAAAAAAAAPAAEFEPDAPAAAAPAAEFEPDAPAAAAPAAETPAAAGDYEAPYADSEEE